MTLGSGLLGPLADRWGTAADAGRRRWPGSVSPLAARHSRGRPTQFVAWRLLTGLALGAGIPSCAALTSEYAPVGRRSLVMGLMNCASPIGAFSAGLLAPNVLAAYGWRATFLIGGVTPLLAAMAIVAAAPESLKFLFVRRPGDPRIAATLRRVAPEINPALVYFRPREGGRSGSVLELLGAVFRARTLLLWTLVALNLFNLYVLISWLPTLLQRSGWSPDASLRGAVLIQLGGVFGGLAMARMLDRGATRRALLMGFLGSAACLGLFMLLPNGPAWAALLLLVGAGVSGSQLSINALSAAYYPPQIKATGVAWALVVGGLGPVAAPLAGAWLITHDLPPVTIIALLAIPSLVCAAGVGLMRQEWQAH